MALQRETLLTALPSIEALLDRAQRARNDIEALEFGRSHREENPEQRLTLSETETEARAHLSGTLSELFHALTVTLEASGLPLEAQALRTCWSAFSAEDLEATNYDHEYEFSDSAAYNVLYRHIAPLRSFSENSQRKAEILRLEDVLRSIPTILRSEGLAPDGEIPLQKIVHRYLRVFYPSFTTTLAISGGVQSFKPDSGIAELGVALEFKYADSEAKARGAVRGVLEDTAGYSGSLDWTHFIGVIFQTEAFLDEHRYRNELRRVNAVTWQAIVVTKSA